jgi:hypothetical protein
MSYILSKLEKPAFVQRMRAKWAFTDTETFKIVFFPLKSQALIWLEIRLKHERDEHNGNGTSVILKEKPNRSYSNHWRINHPLGGAKMKTVTYKTVSGDIKVAVWDGYPER